MHQRILTLLTLLLLWSLPSLAQDPPAPGAIEPNDDGIFVDIVNVNLINLEVFVTDKKGKRILGLTKDDFEIAVDKRPMAVSNFYVVENGKAKGDGIEPLPLPLEDEPTLPGRPAKAPPQPDDQRLHLIIYIDNLNLHPFTRNKAFRFIRTFLRERLRPGIDEVMLITYERSMHVRHPFTSDPELIASTMYDLEDHSAHAVHFDSDRREILQMIYDENNQGRVNLRSRATSYAESIYNDMDFTLRSLSDMVDTLAGLPGRKAILYVSDGLSMRPGEDIFHAVEDQAQKSGAQAQGILMESHRFDMSRDFNQLTNKANANRVTFYTLEAAGLRTYSYMEAQNATPGGGAFIDQVHFSNLQSSLLYMADETGGTSIMNTNNFTSGLDRVADDFDNYYSLGFASGSAESGRYHRIKVRIKGDDDKKYRVRHREGYRDKPLDTRMADGTIAALHFGYQNNSLGLKIEFGQPRPEEKSRRFLVPVSVEIPLGKLSYLPSGAFQRGRLRLFIAARDDEGGVSPVQDVQLPIDIPDAQFETAKSQLYRYDITLQMRKGRQILAVGVHDEIGAVSGFVTRGVSIGDS
jgi:VWFA-related protein